MLDLIHVNPNSGDPIYRQLHEQIVRLIVGGQLPSGTTLPSVRTIAEHFSVNPMTVSRAIQQLVEQGWLERRRGQATQVAERLAATEQLSTDLLLPAIDGLIQQSKQLGFDIEQVTVAIQKRWEEN
ncbi:GntR family transcriptional regulator [Pseudoalteromonas fenneropenaei]|uniref:GntR family transcriptional regulator n=1 Tax=Pseudoalteromonas fenneropenaei TaxID=1737459 RepID=A0ABV7CPZ0_9GAMM